MEPSSKARRLAPLLLVGQSLLYGFGDPISKVAYETMPIYALLSLRYLLAAGLLFLMGRKRVLAGLKQCSWRDWLPPSLCIAAAYISGNAALGLTTATSVAFLRSLSTVMTPLVALALLRRKYHWKHLPIQLAVVLGLYLLCGQGGLAGFGPGEALSLLTALLLALSLVLGQKALGHMDALTLSTVQAAVSALLATLCTPLLDGGWHLELLTPQIGAIILYLAVGCTIAGYLLQNLALCLLSARTVALLQCLCPVMTAFFSRLLLGERLSVPGLLGAAVLLGCVAAESLLKDDDALRSPETHDTIIDNTVSQKEG